MVNVVPDGLFFDGIDKHFGGSYALRNVSLAVGRGEIVALPGENGAGKSTLIKVLSGIHTSDAGAVKIGGKPYHHKPSSYGERQSVAFIHQNLGLTEWMTVTKNMAQAQGYARRFGLIDWAAVEATAAKALARVDVTSHRPHGSPPSAGPGNRLLPSHALPVECGFLVLDEPTASLPSDEVERLFSALRLLRENGVEMIYVSHRLDEIFQISDRVAVLRDGVMIGLRDTHHTTSEELVHMIVGRKTREIVKPEADAASVVLSVKDLRCNLVGPASFDLHAGEILGLVGLRGAGHEDIARALFGMRAYSGTVLLDGKAPDTSSPSRAMHSGIGLVARDRTEESVVASLSIRENTFLNLSASGRGLWTMITRRTENAKAREIGAQVGLSPNDPELAIEALSGGNQQKVVVGRWLSTDRRLLICEDPTAGVDVGAKAEIYALLNAAVALGVALIVVSTDFEEAANICNRAIVFSQGCIVGDLGGAHLTMEQLIQTASASNLSVA